MSLTILVNQVYRYRSRGLGGGQSEIPHKDHHSRIAIWSKIQEVEIIDNKEWISEK